MNLKPNKNSAYFTIYKPAVGSFQTPDPPQLSNQALSLKVCTYANPEETSDCAEQPRIQFCRRPYN